MNNISYAFTGIRQLNTLQSEISFFHDDNGRVRHVKHIDYSKSYVDKTYDSLLKLRCSFNIEIETKKSNQINASKFMFDSIKKIKPDMVEIRFKREDMNGKITFISFEDDEKDYRDLSYSDITKRVCYFSYNEQHTNNVNINNTQNSNLNIISKKE